jgi:hypothetical protein
MVDLGAMVQGNSHPEEPMRALALLVKSSQKRKYI